MPVGPITIAGSVDDGLFVGVLGLVLDIESLLVGVIVLFGKPDPEVVLSVWS